jgi:hypothetical protein
VLRPLEEGVEHLDDGRIGRDDDRPFLFAPLHQGVVHAEGFVAVGMQLDLLFFELNEPAVTGRAPEGAREAGGHRTPPGTNSARLLCQNLSGGILRLT